MAARNGAAGRGHARQPGVSSARRTRWCARWSRGFTTPPARPDEPWLHQSLWHSIKVIFWGFLFSSLIGVPLGILCGALPAMARLTEPFIEFFRYLPAPAFGALAVAVLGIDDAPKVAIIFIGTFFQQVLVIANTTRQLDPALLEAAQTLGATRTQLLSCVVVVPGVITEIYTDMRVLLGLGVDVPDRRRADRRQLRHHLLHQPAGEVPQVRERVRVIILIGLIGLCDRSGAGVAGAAAVPLACKTARAAGSRRWWRWSRRAARRRRRAGAAADADALRERGPRMTRRRATSRRRPRSRARFARLKQRP